MRPEADETTGRQCLRAECSIARHLATATRVTEGPPHIRLGTIGCPPRTVNGLKPRCEIARRSKAIQCRILPWKDQVDCPSGLIRPPSSWIIAPGPNKPRRSWQWCRLQQGNPGAEPHTTCRVNALPLATPAAVFNRPRLLSALCRLLSTVAAVPSRIPLSRMEPPTPQTVPLPSILEYEIGSLGPPDPPDQVPTLMQAVCDRPLASAEEETAPRGLT